MWTARRTPIVRLANIVSSHFAEWIRVIDSKVVPAFKDLVDKGWNLLLKAVKLFQQNSSWLLPLIRNVAIGFGAWTLAIGPIITGLGVLSTAFGGPLTGALAFAAAAFLVIKNWRMARASLEGMNEWIFGTKQLDPKNKGFSAIRGFLKGEVPKAGAVQSGWLNWDNLKIGGNFDQWMTKHVSDQFQTWLGVVWNNIALPWLVS